MSLDLDQVVVSFGGVHAVDGLSLSIPTDSCTGVIGPNGSGKTTTFNAISGFVRVSAGRISLDGAETTGLSPEAMSRKGVVRTFQQPMVFTSLKVGECIEVVASSRAEVRHLLKLGDLERIADGRPAELSYGLMRQLGLMISLATKPKLLLLDEPTSGLSAPEINSLSEVIGGIRAEGVALGIIDHNMSFIRRHCGFLYVLDAGQLIASGAPDQVFADVAVRTAYLGSKGVVNS
jgi:branched-chain amino acid transport system ATP-binding protein